MYQDRRFVLAMAQDAVVHDPKTGQFTAGEEASHGANSVKSHNEAEKFHSAAYTYHYTRKDKNLAELHDSAAEAHRDASNNAQYTKGGPLPKKGVSEKAREASLAANTASARVRNIREMHKK